MKINNYKLFLESNLFDDRTFSLESTSINTICRYYSITNYTINDDGTIDVDGDVNLYRRKLTKLPLKFGKVTGRFTCSGNLLTSLEGSPYWVGKDFSCSENNLETLEGCPKWIGGNFSSTDNNLKTLEGGPEVVIGSYFFQNNKLVNFKGFPEDFDRYVDFYANPVNKLLKDISSKMTKMTTTAFNENKSKSKFIYWCNEFDAITDEGKVIPERMEEVYNKLGMVYED